MRERYLGPLKDSLAEKHGVFDADSLAESWNLYVDACSAMLKSVQGDGDIDAVANNAVARVKC